MKENNCIRNISVESDKTKFQTTTAYTFPTFDNDSTHINGKNGWYFPNENGSFYWMNKENFEIHQRAMENSRGITLTPTKFYLYTKKNPKKAQQISDSAKSIQKSYFNPDHPTKFIIHGFIQRKGSGMNKKIRNSFLGNEECNVVVVDWARARSLDYLSSVFAVPKVGEKVAKMIDYLTLNHGMDIESLTVVGHSLGAHVAGYAGKNVRAGRIPVIIGLDPALPGFDYKKPNKRLNENDADYVETIQTNGGVFGFLMPIGKASFFPNGGERQPGCIENICSHERSVAYYAEAVIQDNFSTIKCENLESAVAKSCGATYSSSRMCAEQNPITAEGVYYVPVNKKFPYGILN